MKKCSLAILCINLFTYIHQNQFDRQAHTTITTTIPEIY